MDVPSLMRQALTFNADRRAIITEDAELTFAQVWDRGVRLANGLIDLGVEPGDRVAGLEDNNLGAADLFLGARSPGGPGAAVRRVTVRLSHEQMIAPDRGECAWSPTQPIAERCWPGSRTRSTSLSTSLVRDGSYEDWLGDQSGDRSDRRRSAPTTGTSSGIRPARPARPKGVGYTQHDWLVNCRNWYYRLPNLEIGTRRRARGPHLARVGLPVPAGVAGTAAPTCSSGPSTRPKVLDMLRRHRVTHAFAPPSMLAHLPPSRRDRPTTAWRCAVCSIGGAPITDATILAGRQAFGDVLYQVFGQTEAVPLTIMTPDEWFADLPGSTRCARPVDCCRSPRLEIRGEEGAAAPTGVEWRDLRPVEAQMPQLLG